MSDLSNQSADVKEEANEKSFSLSTEVFYSREDLLKLGNLSTVKKACRQRNIAFPKDRYTAIEFVEIQNQILENTSQKQTKSKKGKIEVFKDSGKEIKQEEKNSDEIENLANTEKINYLAYKEQLFKQALDFKKEVDSVADFMESYSRERINETYRNMGGNLKAVREEFTETKDFFDRPTEDLEKEIEEFFNDKKEEMSKDELEIYNKLFE